MAGEGQGTGGQGKDGQGTGEIPASTDSLADVLASIRALVSAETAARLPPGSEDEDVVMLTAEMRVAAPAGAGAGDLLAEGIATLPARPLAAATGGAPILDEEALRGVINSIVREELQGELGERIGRNLRKLVRREIGEMLAEERARST